MDLKLKEIENLKVISIYEGTIFKLRLKNW